MKSSLSFILTILLSIAMLIVVSCATNQTTMKDEQGNKSTEFLAEDIAIIADSIESQLPFNSRVLILDFKDLDGVITHFGRYVADKLYIKLSTEESNITYIERQNIEYVLKEQQFQISGYVDEETATRISQLTGATHILSGVVTELENTISIDIKILNVEKGTVIGGMSQEIEKTREVASLVTTIIKTEEQKQTELEEQRQAILQEIEEEKQKRMKALEEEERQKKAELAKLEQEIREKSIIITEYEKQKQVLEEKKAYITKIHDQIDKINLSVRQKLKIGMTLEQVKTVLGKENVKIAESFCYIAGKYFLVFEGPVLTKVVPIGSENNVYGITDDCGDARTGGMNVATY